MKRAISVHVISLQQEMLYWEPLLSPAERQKRDSLLYEEDRRIFTICRGYLRQILGEKLTIAPREISFRFGRYGKPYVSKGSISFNLTHSVDVALIAVGE